MQEKRIIGGSPAKAGNWPWAAMLVYGGSQFCGGSIVNRHWIITAAHCFSDIDSRSVTYKLQLQDSYKRLGNNKDCTIEVFVSVILLFILEE